MADLEELVTCPLCIEKFNLDGRVPKVLDCGHTNCLECLNKHVRKAGRICPQCRQAFEEAPFFVKNNFLICQVLESSIPKDPPPPESAPSAIGMRFFCQRCDRDATDTCLMTGHQVCDKSSMVLKRIQAAKQQAQGQFEREAAMLEDLTDTLDNIKVAVTNKGGVTSRVHRELDELKSQKQALDKTTQSIEKVQTSTFQDNDDVPKALERFLQDNSARLFALEEQKRMLDIARKCTVTVTSEEAGLAWGAKIAVDEKSPAEERVFSYLVYLLLLNQQPWRMDDSPVAPLDLEEDAEVCSKAEAEEEAEAEPEEGADVEEEAEVDVGVEAEAEGEGHAAEEEEDVEEEAEVGMEVEGEAQTAEEETEEAEPGAWAVVLERASWTAGAVATPSLDDLFGQVKQCLIDGHGLAHESENSDDDDDSDTDSVLSDTVSVALPDICQGAKKVFVGRIPTTAKPEEIKGLFSTYGHILYVRFLNSRPAARKDQRYQAEAGEPKPICALIYVPDDTTVENILKNRPIVYQRKGQFERFLLNVQEDRSQKYQAKLEAKRQRKAQWGQKAAQTCTALHNDQSAMEAAEALRRVYVNQVPLDITEDKLKNFFSTFGDVECVNKRRHIAGNKCMAFVTFKDEKSAKLLLEIEKLKPILYQGEGYPDGFALQVREFRSSATRAPARVVTPAVVQNQPGTSCTDIMNTAVSATALAVSAMALSTIEKQRNEAANQAQQNCQQQPPQSFQRCPNVFNIFSPRPLYWKTSQTQRQQAQQHHPRPQQQKPQQQKSQQQKPQQQKSQQQNQQQQNQQQQKSQQQKPQQQKPQQQKPQQQKPQQQKPQQQKPQQSNPQQQKPQQQNPQQQNPQQQKTQQQKPQQQKSQQQKTQQQKPQQQKPQQQKPQQQKHQQKKP